MKQIQQDQIDILSGRFLELHAQEKVIKKELDHIKSEMKDIAGADDIENELITIKHYSSEKIDYKGMVVDSGVKVPDAYKSTSTTVKITVKP